jgi:hypothetical protein
MLGPGNGLLPQRRDDDGYCSFGWYGQSHSAKLPIDADYLGIDLPSLK